MKYLGIDQHARQITISLRYGGGDVVLARQVSTRPVNGTSHFRPLAWVEISPPLVTHLGHRKSPGHYSTQVSDGPILLDYRNRRKL